MDSHGLGIVLIFKVWAFPNNLTLFVFSVVVGSFFLSFHFKLFEARLFFFWILIFPCFADLYLQPKKVCWFSTSVAIFTRSCIYRPCCSCVSCCCLYSSIDSWPFCKHPCIYPYWMGNIIREFWFIDWTVNVIYCRTFKVI